MGTFQQGKSTEKFPGELQCLFELPKGGWFCSSLALQQSQGVAGELYQGGLPAPWSLIPLSQHHTQLRGVFYPGPPHQT